jgi:predicted ABC-type ATPase
VPPRFRLFGGPNGSGKTFLFEQLKKAGTINTEIYVNADRILRDLEKRGNFNFNAYRIRSSEAEFKNSISNSSLYDKFRESDFLARLALHRGVLRYNGAKTDLSAYHASFIATYLASKLFETGQSFCFETVMSHESKIFYLDLAKQFKYKSYLYFVYTDNPELNVARVKLRAAGGLHDVESAKIRERYSRTFQLLPIAIEKADEGYIIDNSEKPTIVIEKKNGKYQRVGGLALPVELEKTLASLINR